MFDGVFFPWFVVRYLLGVLLESQISSIWFLREVRVEANPDQNLLLAFFGTCFPRRVSLLGCVHERKSLYALNEICYADVASEVREMFDGSCKEKGHFNYVRLYFLNGAVERFKFSMKVENANLVVEWLRMYRQGLYPQDPLAFVSPLARPVWARVVGAGGTGWADAAGHASQTHQSLRDQE